MQRCLLPKTRMGGGEIADRGEEEVDSPLEYQQASLNTDFQGGSHGPGPWSCRMEAPPLPSLRLSLLPELLTVSPLLGVLRLFCGQYIECFDLY